MEKLSRWLIFSFLTSVFCLSIFKIQETDAYMHLAFGKLIWQLKGLPAKELFVFTGFDLPFSYSSWLFGLLCHFTYSVAQAPGLILFKATVILATFSILLADALRPYNNRIISILVLSAVVIMSRARFVERPEIFMMLFLSFSIFSLNAYVQGGRRYLYALPLTHLLWANMHSSIILMFVPFCAFLLGGALESAIATKGSPVMRALDRKQFATIGVVFVASFVSSLASPYFLDQYLMGFAYLANPYHKTTILELQPTTWQLTKGPFLIAAATCSVLIANRKRTPIIDLFLFLPFCGLSFVAVRFGVLAGIVSAPIIARNISAVYEERKGRFRLNTKWLALLALAWIALYSGVMLTNMSFPGFERSLQLGLDIDSTLIPEGALQFMDRHRITGRVLNPFEWGGYVAWRDYPVRTVSLDSRGYADANVMETVQTIDFFPHNVETLRDKYDFDCVLRYRHSPDPAVTSAQRFAHPSWALVYWDDTAILYLRRGGKYDALIGAYEYRYVKPDMELPSALIHDRFTLENLLNELNRKLAERSSVEDTVETYVLLGNVYKEAGMLREAILAYEKVRPQSIPTRIGRAKLYSTIAFLYHDLKNLDASTRYYAMSFALHDEATSRYYAAENYYEKGNKKEAMLNLEKALSLDLRYMPAYQPLIALYKEFDMIEEARKREMTYASLMH